MISTNCQPTAVTLLAGAGAECGKPYDLPIGNAFTWETCFTKNPDLYQALDKYYTPRLGKLGKGFPHKYQDEFLYSASSPEFKRLVSELVPERDGDSLGQADIQTIKKVLGTEFPLDANNIDNLSKGKLSSDLYSKAFEAIIERQALKDNFTDNRETPLKEAYFGTIETHFSSLLNPGRRNVSFWKLVNYYWSAFFSVSRSLIHKARPITRGLHGSDYYSYVLNDLKNIVTEVTRGDLYGDAECAKTYYGELGGLFDHVITTNYTDLSTKLSAKDGGRPIHISGALWQFESPRSLTIRDIRDDGEDADSFIFPYLLTQVPVKPIVCWEQASELSRMVEALNETRDLFVLGYSFCRNDAHVASIVASWLSLPGRRELHYFDYDGGCTPEKLCDLLRVNKDAYEEKVHVCSCKDIRAQVEAIASI